MTTPRKASPDRLCKPRTRIVEILVDGEPAEFVVRKLKVGEQKRLAAECINDAGQIDTDLMVCMIAEMCVVEPALTADDIDEIDADVFAALSVEIAKHSGVSDAADLIVADPQEGAAAAKSFPAAS